MQRPPWLKAARLALIAGALALLLLAAAGVTAQQTPPAHPAVNQITDAARAAFQTALHEFVAGLRALTQMPLSLTMRLVLAVGGLALVSAGWRMNYTALIIAGFAAGSGLIALYLSRGGTGVTFIALFLGGIIGAGMSLFVFYVALFALGFYAGAALALLAAAPLGLAPVTLLGLGLAGLAGGALLLALRGPLLLLAAAAAGGLMLSLGLGLGPHGAALAALAGLLAQSALSAAYPAPAPQQARDPEPSGWGL